MSVKGAVAALGLLACGGADPAMDAIYARRMIGKDVIEPKAWTTITPGTGWDAVTGIGQYAIDANGDVVFRGSIRYVSGAGVAFTLPAGVRPSLLRGFAVASVEVASATMFVQDNGNVTFNTVSPYATFFLDGARFPAEQ